MCEEGIILLSGGRMSREGTYEEGMADAWNIIKRLLDLDLDIKYLLFKSTAIDDVVQLFKPSEVDHLINLYYSMLDTRNGILEANNGR